MPELRSQCSPAAERMVRSDSRGGVMAGWAVRAREKGLYTQKKEK